MEDRDSVVYRQRAGIRRRSTYYCFQDNLYALYDCSKNRSSLFFYLYQPYSFVYSKEYFVGEYVNKYVFYVHRSERGDFYEFINANTNVRIQLEFIFKKNNFTKTFRLTS